MLRAEGLEDDPNRLAYLSFRGAHPNLTRRQDELRSSHRDFEAQEVEAYLLSEYLRRDHAARSRSHIHDQYGNRLVYDNYDFASRLADISRSHTEDASSLNALPCWELVRAPGERCNWRFVAIVLRLADILDFDPKRTPRVLFDHLGIRSQVSVREWKKHRSITGWEIAPGRIAFAAQCRDPVIEKGIRDFVRAMDRRDWRAVVRS